MLSNNRTCFNVSDRDFSIWARRDWVAVGDSLDKDMAAADSWRIDGSSFITGVGLGEGGTMVLAVSLIKSTYGRGIE
jgi:hypothetical protein